MSDAPNSPVSTGGAFMSTTTRGVSERANTTRVARMTPIKVAQLLYTGLGGHGSVVFSLIQADRENRWTPALAFFGIEPLLPAYREMCKKFGIEEYGVFQCRPGTPFKAWWNLFRWILREKPDVILLHSLSAFLPCYLGALISGARLVAIEHTPVEIKSRRDLAFSALSQRVADHTVCLSPVSRDNLLKRLGSFGSSKGVAVIPNGVDTQFFSPGERSFKGSLIHLGMAGRFTKQKRQDILVNMLDVIRRWRPDISVQLSFAGSGETLEDVRETAQRAGVSEYVEFLGTLDEDTLAKWYRELDIYVHAAEAENMPTTVLQAMATAVPVVSTDIPPMRVVLEARAQNGLLVERNEGDAFAAAVIELVDDPQKRRTLGEAARKTAVSIFGNEAMFRAYDAICRREPNGKAPGPGKAIKDIGD